MYSLFILIFFIAFYAWSAMDHERIGRSVISWFKSFSADKNDLPDKESDSIG